MQDAELFAIVVRRHWHIENGLHWALDVVFREDRLRSKEKNGIHNLGLIRRFVMFIINLMKAYYHRSMNHPVKPIEGNLELRTKACLPYSVTQSKIFNPAYTLPQSLTHTFLQYDKQLIQYQDSSLLCVP